MSCASSIELFDNPLVSVVIVTYKRPISIVKRALDSVIQQTYPHIEIILVNDNPDDLTLSDELKRLVDGTACRRCRYVETHENSGSCVARNLGLKLANGLYVGFLDDDDEWIEVKIEKQLEVIRQDSKIGLVYCPILFEQSDDTWQVVDTGVEPSNKEKAILCGNFIGPTSAPLIKTSVLCKLGGFDESFPSCQDYELWVRIVFSTTVAKCNVPLVRYYYSSDSTYKTDDKYYAGIQKLWMIHRKDYLKYPKTLSRFLCRHAIYFLKHRRFDLYMKLRVAAIREEGLNAYTVFPIVALALEKVKKRSYAS